jgi:hypothetical protein
VWDISIKDPVIIIIIIIIIIIDFMEQSHSWQADSHSADEGIPPPLTQTSIIVFTRARCSYPEPVEFNPHSHILYLTYVLVVQLSVHVQKHVISKEVRWLTLC